MRPYRRRGGLLPAGSVISGEPPCYTAEYTDKAGRVRTVQAVKHRGKFYLLREHYYVSYRDDAGVVRRVSTGLSDYAGALAYGLRLLRESKDIRAGVTNRAEINRANFARREFKAVAAEYLNELSGRAGKLHLHNLTARLERLRREIGLRVMADVQPAAVNRWAAARKAEGMSHRSLNVHVAAVFSLFNWAYRTGQTDQRLTGLTKFRESDDPRRPRRAFTPQEFQRLVEAAPVRANVYRIALMTGLRKAELAAIDVSQIELDDFPTITLSATQTKARRNERIPLDRFSAELIRSVIGERRTGKLFSSLPRHTTFNRDLERAGIPKRTVDGLTLDFHSLRKTYVTWLLISGAHPRVVMSLARHSDIRLTTQTYTDSRQLPGREAVETMSEMAVRQTVLKLDQNGQEVTVSGQEPAEGTIDETQVNKLFYDLHPRGFEPLTFCSGGKRSQGSKQQETKGETKKENPTVSQTAPLDQILANLKGLTKAERIKLLADLME